MHGLLGFAPCHHTRSMQLNLGTVMMKQTNAKTMHDITRSRVHQSGQLWLPSALGAFGHSPGGVLLSAVFHCC